MQDVLPLVEAGEKHPIEIERTDPVLYLFKSDLELAEGVGQEQGLAL
jgi:hypothetical protein